MEHLFAVCVTGRDQGAPVFHNHTGTTQMDEVYYERLPKGQYHPQFRLRGMACRPPRRYIPDMGPTPFQPADLVDDIKLPFKSIYGLHRYHSRTS